MPVVLITGVRGQDGQLLAGLMAERGWEVHGTARSGEDDESGREPLGVVVHEADLLRPEGFARLIADLAPDAVVNLAGISSVAQSWREPTLTSAVSGHAVAALLEACRAAEEATDRPVRFVQASSSEMFGDPPSAPQDETTPLRPINPYGAAKSYAHTLVRLHRERGLFGAAAILYNHESTLRPPTFVTRKITRGVAGIARGRETMLRLGNLDARRDWSWAPDVVDGIRRIVEADEPDDFVIASGVSHSVREFVAAAFDAVGIDDWARHVVVDQELIRPADVAEMVGDAGRIRDRLGWRPEVGFEEMVRRMVEHDLDELDASS